MAALVAVETVLLVALVVLVAGLLRSHAEILRRLGPPEADGAGRLEGSWPTDEMSLAQPDDAASRDAGLPAPAVQGTTPGGDAVALSVGAAGAPPILLAFLSSGCGTCAGFWDGLGRERLPAGVETVIVTHGSERERPARVRSLAPDGVPVIMSSPAWSDYRVPGSPYFVLVRGSIRGEGVATTWAGLASLVSDAIEDGAIADDPIDASGDSAQPSLRSNVRSRARDVDAALAAGGIGPDHPSLYPAGQPRARR